MTNRKTQPVAVGGDRSRRVHRRATVLILVMTILGILFVTGVAFMATMSFESEMIRNEKVGRESKPAAADVFNSIDDVVATGAAEIIDAATGQSVSEQPDSALESISSIPFSETPGRFNTFSPVEPYVHEPWLMGANQMQWGWSTDVEAMMGIETNYLDFQRLNTEWKSGVEPYTDYPDTITPVDADGDGIVDANQVDLERLGFKRREIEALAKVLNPQSKPKGHVYLGVRVVPHGGMVNLAESHPLLIRKLLFIDPTDTLPEKDPGYVPYSPVVEEAPLRRRGGMLPPRDLPPTRILGNPMHPNVDTYGADFLQLYWPNETAVDHRYWPFAPDEFDSALHPNDNVWRVRMDPQNADATNAARDQYDRRHLVTSISYDDLLRRASVIEDPTTGARMDLVDWLIEKKKATTNDDFPYVDYPFEVENTYTGPSTSFDTKNWDDCLADADCEINPRKGHLRVSMPQLDVIEGKYGLELAKRVIQDAFTMLLLHARNLKFEGSFREPGEFGEYLVPNPPNSGEQKWEPNYDAIAEAAAMLAANMIDYADIDDEPTKVMVRNADYTNPGTFGTDTGKAVYGLEVQPFITEAAASANRLGLTAVADPATSSYAVEIFNPYDTSITLDGVYSLQVLSTTNGPVVVPLTGALSAEGFASFTWAGDTGAYPGTPLANLDFAAKSTIALLRTLSDGTVIVVDQFPLVDSDVGTMDGAARSRQRYVRDTMANKWYAVSPDAFETAVETIGQPNVRQIVAWSPVEPLLANTGSFTSAFPTTGSLLLLMRYANALGEPFNARLGPKTVHPIDDGRLPIYDIETQHHVAPWLHPTDTETAAGIDQGKPKTTKELSGLVEHLPWGQLVFDYFTALPLTSTGPYADHSLDPSFIKGIRENQPKVDLDGIRVHGRININAAPWFVMKGIPFIPMQNVPPAFQDTFRTTLGLLSTPDAEPQPIGPARAKGIVAYRDQREIKQGFGTAFTGNYGDDAEFGRAWNLDSPFVRRGMGYLSVGELANIRHPSAAADTDGLPRLDDGVVSMSGGHQGTYLEAVATLACLSDWVTVRSQVFTTYGTLRGDIDDTIEDKDPDVQLDMRLRDVNSRALRFQQTIDRLPTFLGIAEPAIIGNRVIATYNDVRND